MSADREQRVVEIEVTAEGADDAEALRGLREAITDFRRQAVIAELTT